jgi:sugar phosphate isomerase/epimerase
MTALPPFSLAQLTWLDFSPPELVSLAARTGYDYAGIRLLPASPGGTAYRLMEDAPMLRETLARIRDTGVGILDLEMIRLAPDFRAADYLRFFEVGQRLGAKAILVAGDDPDESRLTAHFAELCEASRPYGLTADLEFMPWTEVPAARDALRIVQAAGQPNGGVLVDALHFGRSDSSFEDIATIPRNLLNYAQICDGPGPTPTTAEALIHTARIERLLPGEGVIDVAGLFRKLPPDLPVSVEVPTESRATLGPDRWASEALSAAKATLAQARAA